MKIHFGMYWKSSVRVIPSVEELAGVCFMGSIEPRYKGVDDVLWFEYEVEVANLREMSSMMVWNSTI